MSEPYANLRAEFVRLLTCDSETSDRRRKEFNQALFIPAGEGILGAGQAVWSDTTLDMVLSKFDKAVKAVKS